MATTAQPLTINALHPAPLLAPTRERDCDVLRDLWLGEADSGCVAGCAGPAGEIVDDRRGRAEIDELRRWRSRGVAG